MKRITIKDLAELLQISPSTVSRALSNHPDISEALKTKVKEAAEAFNYVPNDFAINFRKKSSKVIGLILPKMSMFFIPSIIEGIAAKLHKEGYQFFILFSDESLETEKLNLQTCANSRVDGVLISLTSETHTLDHFKVLDDLEIPVVVIDKSISEGQYDQVVFNSKRDAKECAESFIKEGCKKILAIFGNQELEITQVRKKYFLRYLEKHPEIEYSSIFCNSADEVTTMCSSLLDTENFDGVFCMSDETLAGFNCALKEKQMSAKNFKVVAMSEGIFPKYLNPHFQFKKNDGLKMGMLATDLLLKKIRNPENTMPQVHYI